MFDPESGVNFTAEELSAFFETKKATISNKAGLIQKTAKIFIGDPDFSSAEIVDMFRVYETEEGLLIPGSILDNLENQRDENEAQPASLSHPAPHKIQRRSKARTERSTRDPGKKDVDDRQLKLFDDE